jgi:hypothetical protein
VAGHQKVGVLSSPVWETLGDQPVLDWEFFWRRLLLVVGLRAAGEGTWDPLADYYTHFIVAPSMSQSNINNTNTIEW